MTVGYFVARKFVLTNQRSISVRKFLKIELESGLDGLSAEDQKELDQLQSDIF